jgi:hypothetical protein
MVAYYAILHLLNLCESAALISGQLLASVTAVPNLGDGDLG